VRDPLRVSLQAVARLRPDSPDHLAYDFYGLTADEIKIVAGGS
jgi:hypothetical protein